MNFVSFSWLNPVYSVMKPILDPAEMIPTAKDFFRKVSQNEGSFDHGINLLDRFVQNTTVWVGVFKFLSLSIGSKAAFNIGLFSLTPQIRIALLICEIVSAAYQLSKAASFINKGEDKAADNSLLTFAIYTVSIFLSFIPIISSALPRRPADIRGVQYILSTIQIFIAIISSSKLSWERQLNFR